MIGDSCWFFVTKLFQKSENPLLSWLDWWAKHTHEAPWGSQVRCPCGYLQGYSTSLCYKQNQLEREHWLQCKENVSQRKNKQTNQPAALHIITLQLQLSHSEMQYLNFRLPSHPQVLSPSLTMWNVFTKGTRCRLPASLPAEALTFCRKKGKLLKPLPAQGSIYEKMYEEHCLSRFLPADCLNCCAKEIGFSRSDSLLQINFVFLSVWTDSCQVCNTYLNMSPLFLGLCVPSDFMFFIHTVLQLYVKMMDLDRSMLLSGWLIISRTPWGIGKFIHSIPVLLF